VGWGLIYKSFICALSPYPERRELNRGTGSRVEHTARGEKRTGLVVEVVVEEEAVLEILFEVGD